MAKAVPQYIKNVVKSTAYATKDIAKQIMPETFDFLETNTDLGKSITSDLRNLNGIYNQAKSLWDDSGLKRDLIELKNNALEDIKTGNINNVKRANDLAFKASGWEDALTGFDDVSVDKGSVSPEVKSMATIASSSMTSTSQVMASMTGSLTNTMTGSTDVLVKNANDIASKTTVNNYKMFQSMANIMSSIASDVSVIAGSTKNQTEYYNQTARMYESMKNNIESTAALLKESVEMQRNQYKEYNKAQDPKTIQNSTDDIMIGNTLNIKDYFETVMKRAKKEWEMSAIGSMSQGSMGVNPFQMIAANPLGFLSSGIGKKLISRDLEKSMKELDKTMGGFAKSSLLKMSSTLRDKGETNPIFDTLYRVLGINIDSSSKPMKTDKYVKGPVPYNGVADRALTEVIPTYLRKMLASMTRSEEMIYNFDDGKFQKISDIEKNYQNTIDSAYSSINDMKDQISKLINTFTFSNELQETIDKDIDKLLKGIVDQGIFYNPEKMDYDTLKRKGIYLDGGGDAFNLINSAFKAQGRSEWNQFNKEVIDAIDTKKIMSQNMTKDSVLKGFTAMDNGFKKSYNSETGNYTIGLNSGLHVQDNYKKTVFDYLRDIRTILLEGIKVYSFNVDPNEFNEARDLEVRMSRYEETYESFKPKAKYLYNKSQDQLKEQAKTSTKRQVIEYMSDIGYSPKTLDNLFARKKAENDEIEKNGGVKKEETDAITDTVNKAKSGISKLFGVGKQIATIPSEMLQRTMDSLNESMLDFLYGNNRDKNVSFFDKLMERVNKTAESVYEVIDTKVIKPVNSFLFDEKNGVFTKIKNKVSPIFNKLNNKLFDEKNGVITGIKNNTKEFLFGNEDGSKKGLLSTFKNTALDVKDEFMNVVSGRSYTSRTTGEVIPARKDNMLGIIKTNVTELTSSVSNFIKTNMGKSEFMTDFKDKIHSNIARFSNAMFGGEDMSMTPGEFYRKNLAHRMPSTIKGAIAGIGLSMFTPLGLIGGVTLGSVGGLGMTSEKVKTVLFGEEGSKNRIKIDEIGNKVNKALPKIGIGSLIGGALSLFTPLGLVGGLAIGGVGGLMSSSQRVTNFLFGDPEKGEQTILGKYKEKFKEALPAGITGGGLGLIGSFFLPGGPIGGALMGFSLGLASQSNAIKTYLFGNEDPETGKRTGGLFGKAKLYVQTEIFAPLKTFVKELSAKGMHFFRTQLINPVLEVFDPFKKELSLIKDRVLDSITAAKDAVVDKFNNVVVKPFGESMNKHILDPMKKMFSNLFSGMFSAIKNIITAPSKAINAVGMNLMEKHKKMGVADYYDEWKAKKEKRDKKAEDSYKKAMEEVNYQKSKNDLTRRLMRKKGYDPTDPEVQKAMGFMNVKNNENISNINKNAEKQTSILDRLSNAFGDFKTKWQQQTSMFADKAKDKYDTTKDTVKTKASNAKESVQETISKAVKHMDENIDNAFGKKKKSGFNADGTKKQTNTIFDTVEPQAKAKQENTTQDPTIKLNVQDKAKIKTKPNMNYNTGNMSQTNENKSSSIGSPNMPKAIDGLLMKAVSDISSIDSQVGGTGYNTEMISNILIDQFGYPSIMPRGARGVAKKVKGMFGLFKDIVTGPFKIIGSIISSPKKLLSSITKPIIGTIKMVGNALKAIPGELYKAGKSILKIGIEAVMTVGETVASVIQGVAKSIPAVVGAVGSMVTETTKALGQAAVETIKVAGSIGKTLVDVTGTLTKGFVDLATKTLPVLGKTIVGVTNTFINLGKSIASGAFKLLTMPFKAIKNKTKMPVSINRIDLLDKVNSVMEINNVKNVETIGDTRIYESMGNIVTAVHSLKTGENANIKASASSTKAANTLDNATKEIRDTMNNLSNTIKNNEKKKEEKTKKRVNITGNEQVDAFKAKDKEEADVMKAMQKEKMEIQAQKANIGTHNILSRVFKKGGMLSTIGTLLITGLPLLWNFIKNIKKNALELLGNALGKILPGGIGSGISNLLGGSNGTNVVNTVTDKISDLFGKKKDKTSKNSPVGHSNTILGDIGEDLVTSLSDKATGKVKDKFDTIKSEKAEKKAAKKENKGKVTLELDEPKPTTKSLPAGKPKAETLALPAPSHTSTSNTIENVAFSVADESGNVISKGGKAPTKALTTVAKAGAKKEGVGIISKILNSAPVKKLAGSKIGSALPTLSKTITNSMSKAGSSVFGKIAAKAGALVGSGAVTAGVVPAIWYGGTLLSGAAETNRIFGASPNYKPSALMRTIAGFSKLVSNEFTLGLIPAKTIAELIGSAVLSDKEKQELTAGKNMLNDEYNAFLAENPESDMTLDQFNEQQNKSVIGKITGNVNDLLHGNVDENSLLGKGINLGKKAVSNTINTAKWVGNGIAKGATAVKDFAVDTFNGVKDYAMNNTFLSGLNDDKIRETFGLNEDAEIQLKDRFAQSLGSTLSNLTGGLIDQESISKTAKGAFVIGEEMWEGLKTKIGEAKEKAVEGVKTMDNNIGSLLGFQDEEGNPISLSQAVGGAVISGVQKVKNFVGAAMNKGKEVWGNISDKFDEMKEKAKSGFEKLGENIGKMLGIDDKDNEGLFSGAYKKFKTAVTDKFNSLTSFFQDKANQATAQQNLGGNGLEPGERWGAGEQTASTSSLEMQNGAVYYSQNAQPWASINYGYGKNISQSGCGPTSAAMLLSSVTGQAITPQDTASFSLANGYRVNGNGTSWGFFAPLGKKYGVNFSQTASMDQVKAALAEGRPAVLSGQGAPPFTRGGHFVMAVGVDGSGNIIINDPVSKARSIAYAPSIIQSGMRQGWISDKKLTGGAVSSASSTSTGGATNSTGVVQTQVKDTDPFMTALAKLGSLTTGMISSSIAGQVFDPAALEQQASANVGSIGGTQATGGSVGVNKGSINGYATGTAKISSQVLALRPRVAEQAAKYGISDQTDLLMALIMQESGGSPNALANDPMQSAEGHGLAAGALHDQQKSIEWGVEEFASRLKDTGGDIPLTLQSYNYGKGFINYVKNKGGTMTQELANQFSNEQAAKMGWRSYGDKQYAAHVLRYYNPGGSGDENLDIEQPVTNLSTIYDLGGNGAEESEIKIDTAKFATNKFDYTTDRINSTLAIQDSIKSNNNNSKYMDRLISLLEEIATNTKETATAVKANGAKLDNIKVQPQQNNNDTKKTSDKTTTTKQDTTDPFASFANKNATGNSDKFNKAYELARNIARGRRH